MKHKEIFVYADWVELGKLVLMGVLFSDIIRGKEVFSFEYSDLWLDSKQRSILDPDLGVDAGPQYIRDYKSNFGLFLDSSPNRWGRVLMLYLKSFLLVDRFVKFGGKYLFIDEIHKYKDWSKELKLI